MTETSTIQNRLLHSKIDFELDGRVQAISEQLELLLGAIFPVGAVTSEAAYALFKSAEN